MEKGKISFLLLLKREKKCLTLAAYFLRLETPSLPACYLLREKPTVDSRGQAEEQLQHSLLWRNKESTSYSGNEQQVGSLVTMETRREPHPSWLLRLNTLKGQRSFLC